MNNCAKLFWNPCINVEVMARTSSIYDYFIMKDCAILFWKPCSNVEVMTWTSSMYDHFIIWPSSVTLVQPTWTNVSNGIAIPKAKLVWNPCMNVEVMALTSSIYNHFIISPSSVIFTFNLPEQMFQMALLLLKENNYVKLVWNPCIKCRSYGPDELNLWRFHHLLFKCDLDLQPTWTS